MKLAERKVGKALLTFTVAAVMSLNFETPELRLVSPAHAKESPKIFHGLGVITAIDSASRNVTIDHEAIPGFMDAMEMAYELKSPSTGAGLKKGDKVEFDIDGTTSTIITIKKIGVPRS
jgi:Cu(I)/Ag(I) efflux system periplasmic protein CusF